MKERPFVSVSENHNVPIKAPWKIILSTIELRWFKNSLFPLEKWIRNL